MPEEYKKSLSENGGGSEYAGYLLVTHNEKVIRFESDAMEPEDAIFPRDLNWIKGAIEQAYELGKRDAEAEDAIADANQAQAESDAMAQAEAEAIAEDNARARASSLSRINERK